MKTNQCVLIYMQLAFSNEAGFVQSGKIRKQKILRNVMGNL